ncbi:MAG: CoA transferase [Novosphingobium sp.]|uniref:CaiB/BaiF CoA transferase family protein n=1 Tax=Novosphingobium sp. TaxID=1874826 RepID=UPI001E079622|nr:CaiB/BaiF CoA-transferase family protein [Novosphingobium sp.]MCB2057807.1 CoA transferase [Novosphingobium sp.]MCP5385739.1 CoA transferase [Novosphingobium sp.]
MTSQPEPAGPLAGIRVLDLSRVLAGPWCTQMLGDLGAEVIKVEQPGQGDDTRRWGPPFLDDGSRDSAYYLCANRNKRSIAIDMARPEGAALIRRLAAEADVVVENFRVGGLAKYGLDYAALSAVKPDLVYCSITGFGQYGPDKDKGGYDFLIQGMSGLMSVTGQPDGQPGAGPMKAGIPVADLSTGLYAVISILAALQHRSRTGEGQHIDLALLDTQLVMLANQASNWLNGGAEPRRMGNLHPNMVPYQVYSCSDGDVIVALGNDRQFAGLCRMLELDGLATDPRFASTAARSENRDALNALLEPAIAGWGSEALIAAMEMAKLPGGRINSVPEALTLPQVDARGLVREIEREDGTAVRFLGFPGQFSATPPIYRKAPPRSAEDTESVLSAALGLDQEEIARLLAEGIIADRL